MVGFREFLIMVITMNFSLFIPHILVISTFKFNVIQKVLRINLVKVVKNDSLAGILRDKTMDV